jgi:hypothetical protein
MHDQPIDRFADEARILIPTADIPASCSQWCASASSPRPGVDRRQSLLGAVRADRQDGSGRAPGGSWVDLTREVEVRDRVVHEQLFGAPLLEAAA